MLFETDYRALADLNQEQRGSVVAIGNFDGVHRGHQALLAEAKKIADTKGLPLVALTFTPHPRLYFKPDQPGFLLTDLAQKNIFLHEAGAKHVLALAFDASLAMLPAAQFISDMLVTALQVRHVIVGENFIFGAQRGGDITLLKNAGAEQEFSVTGLDLVNEGAEKISSERIRQHLRAGQVKEAASLLGRPWQIRGVVVQGHQRGRTLGFPTANLGLGAYLHPAFGVYQARIGIDGTAHKAVVNIGQRPTIGVSGPLLEAHVLDFAGDLYGKTVTIDLLDFLRPEQKFADLNALQAQIAKDVAQIRDLPL